ncbi:UNVERIFIED_CONTAM: hypothetical protein FKN15_009769 [Acipenser sinensis]
MQPSPMSSNPSITGSDVMRPDYIPSHRHSALIPPSYRATPDYETVMRQKNRGVVQADRQSHSMRNLNIGNSYAYSRPDPLVYSQPEIREHAQFSSHNANHYPFHLNYSFHSPSPYPYPTDRCQVVGAVSVPELTNVQLQAQDYPAPNIMRTQVYRPPPPYPRPANSTPDLSRHLYVSSSNPDLITRRIHHSVQTFQEDSLPVAHSLQEVSEPLFTTRHPHMQKRNSIEIAALALGFENMRVKERTMSASAAEAPPRVTASGSQLKVFLERTKAEESPSREDASYGHKKSLSDATMLVHSSEEEEETEEENSRHTPQYRDAAGGTEPHVGILGQDPNDSLPSYPYDSVPSHPSHHGYTPQTLIGEPENEKLCGEGEPMYLAVDGRTQRRGEGILVPSVSESDLSVSARLRARQDSLKKRPVSDVPSGKRNPLEGLPPLGGLKKGSRSDIKKIGPLKLAALNGLTLSRMPLHDESKHEPEKAPNDERCKILEERLEQGMVFTEYEQVPKKRANAECSIALQPESAERNRFQDVLPYDDTRVELVPTKENNTGYINASHIKMNVGGHEWSYLATQGPLQNTCQDFWQMVWEQGVAIIAMVTAEEMLDITTVLDMLRQQRMMMVQTIAQYTFVYKVLIQFLKNSRLI